MNCPICDNVRMRQVEKMSVAIDICPDCKGVWLDRGELEKLMYEVPAEKQEYSEPRRSDRDDRDYDDHRNHDAHGGYNQNHNKKKKKTSVFDVFGDLFD